MKTKGNLKTVRFAPEEDERMAHFMSEHPYIKEFSTLVRAALWNFLKGYSSGVKSYAIPSFLWEYELSHGEILEIIRGPQKGRLWLVAKMLEHARWNEIWDYLDLKIIERDLPLLKLSPRTRRHWEESLRIWKGRAA